MALIARDTCARNPCAGLCIRARTLVGPGQEFLEDTCDGRLCVSLVSGLSLRCLRCWPWLHALAGFRIEEGSTNILKGDKTSDCVCHLSRVLSYFLWPRTQHMESSKFHNGSMKR